MWLIPRLMIMRCTSEKLRDTLKIRKCTGFTKNNLLIAMKVIITTGDLITHLKANKMESL